LCEQCNADRASQWRGYKGETSAHHTSYQRGERIQVSSYSDQTTCLHRNEEVECCQTGWQYDSVGCHDSHATRHTSTSSKGHELARIATRIVTSTATRTHHQVREDVAWKVGESDINGHEVDVCVVIYASGFVKRRKPKRKPVKPKREKKPHAAQQHHASEERGLGEVVQSVYKCALVPGARRQRRRRGEDVGMWWSVR
jgi:hypothetical protein